MDKRTEHTFNVLFFQDTKVDTHIIPTHACYTSYPIGSCFECIGDRGGSSGTQALAPPPALNLSSCLAGLERSTGSPHGRKDSGGGASSPLRFASSDTDASHADDGIRVLMVWFCPGAAVSDAPWVGSTQERRCKVCRGMTLSAQW